ncbi:hypothetical protein [Brachymonas sp. M4Q-1]|uniref:hypothetical protein n=1 Tax=Brachymonas sp. M4Q-1 TaxID=3416906 RepID=UPI003CE7EEB4
MSSLQIHKINLEKINFAIFACIFSSVTLAGCHEKKIKDQPSSQQTRTGIDTTQSKSVSISQRQNSSSKSMDYQSLVPQGYKIIQVQQGDLNNDEITDALILIEEKNSTSELAGEGAKRILMVITGKEGGGYEVAARNNKLVPCKTCGGISGDPFGYMNIQPGGAIHLLVEGGSREHWSSEYFFKFNESQKNWSIEKILMESSDSESGKSISRKYLPKNIKQGEFSAFDPNALAAPTIK